MIGAPTAEVTDQLSVTDRQQTAAERAFAEIVRHCTGGIQAPDDGA